MLPSLITNDPTLSHKYQIRLKKSKLNTTTLSIKTLSIIIFNAYAMCHLCLISQCLCQMSFMMNFAIKSILPSVIILWCREHDLTICDKNFITLILGLCISNLPLEVWLSSFVGFASVI